MMSSRSSSTDDLRRQARAEKQRRREAAGNDTPLTFREFIARVNPRYQFYRHCEELIAVLQRVADDELRRVMVFEPPRHSKSETVTRLFSAYYLYRHPDRWCAIASYGADLAYTLSRAAREYYERGGGVLHRASRAVKHWQTRERGGLWAAGVGGTATGKGYHCFPGDTCVTTEYGKMRIDVLFQLRARPRVLSFNHDTHTLEWQPIIAAAAQPGKPLVEITLSTGGRMRCTTDHPVFSVERGYQPAGHLVPGETVIQVAPVQDVPAMRRRDRTPRSVSVVPPNGAHLALSHSLRTVWGRVHTAASSDRQSVVDGVCRSVLLQSVQPGASQRQTSPPVQSVRRAHRNAHKSVLSTLPAIAIRDLAATARYSLRILRKCVQAPLATLQVLWSRLSKLCTRNSNAWRGQQPLQNRNQLRRLVSQDAPHRIRTGRKLLRRVRRNQSPAFNAPYFEERRAADSFVASRSLHRSRPNQQSYREPHCAVHAVPQSAPSDCRCWQAVTISSITPFSEEPQWVYDLQVAGNHNFFADNILAHNCGIIDDPVKDQAEAASEAIRKRNKEWYGSVWATREEPGGAQIVVLTRWHEDDLAGYLLELEQDEPEQWYIVHLPAIADPNDQPEYPASCTIHPDWRAPGEPLCEERYPLERLRKVARRLGAYFFGALFQQRPRPRDGGMFSRAAQFVSAAPSGVTRLRYWDKAGAAPGKGDYTVGLLMAYSKALGRWYIEDVVRGQWPADERNEKMRETATLDKQRYGRVRQWIEQPPGLGKEATDVAIKVLRGFPAFANPVRGDKVERADDFAAQWQAGNVYLMEAPWNRAYLEELRAFPTGTNDDQVDASSGAFLKLTAPDDKPAGVLAQATTKGW